jgi:hypothetical protein
MKRIVYMDGVKDECRDLIYGMRTELGMKGGSGDQQGKRDGRGCIGLEGSFLDRPLGLEGLGVGYPLIGEFSYPGSVGMGMMEGAWGKVYKLSRRRGYIM